MKLKDCLLILTGCLANDGYVDLEHLKTDTIIRSIIIVENSELYISEEVHCKWFKKPLIRIEKINVEDAVEYMVSEWSFTHGTTEEIYDYIEENY